MSIRKRERQQRRVSISPVPRPLWYSNLRSPSALGPHEWRKVRASLLADHSGECESCGNRAKKWFAHEVWSYKTSKSPAIAKLKRVSIHCVKCHACEHFPRTVKFGTQAQVASTIKHYCRVNGVNRDGFYFDLSAAMARWDHLSNLEWEVHYGPYSSLVAERRARPKKEKAKLRLHPAERADPSRVRRGGRKPLFGRPMTDAEHAARYRYFKELRDSP